MYSRLVMKPNFVIYYGISLILFLFFFRFIFIFILLFILFLSRLLSSYIAILQFRNKYFIILNCNFQKMKILLHLFYLILNRLFFFANFSHYITIVSININVNFTILMIYIINSRSLVIYKIK